MGGVTVLRLSLDLLFPLPSMLLCDPAWHNVSAARLYFNSQMYRTTWKTLLFDRFRKYFASIPMFVVRLDREA